MLNVHVKIQNLLQHQLQLQQPLQQPLKQQLQQQLQQPLQLWVRTTSGFFNCSNIIYYNLHIDCVDPDYYADGECDDQNNVEACGWDGGDCCGPNVNTNWCTECTCKDPAFTTTSTTTTTTTTTSTTTTTTTTTTTATLG